MISSKHLARNLQGILIGTALCGIVVYIVVMPICLKEMFPQSSIARTVWMGFLLLALLPCYGVLYQGWSIAERIGQDRSFCPENAASLYAVSRLAALDTLFVFVVQTVFLAIGLSRASIALIALVVVFVGIAFTVAAMSLAHLVKKASELQEESDATV